MPPSNIKYTFAILGSALLYGLITAGGRYLANLGFSLYEISMLILFFPIPILPVIFFKSNVRIPRALFSFFILFGLVGSLLQLAQFAGIILGLPVAIVAVLLYTQPIWTTLFGKVFLQEAITPKKVLAAAIAMTGVLILLNPTERATPLNFPGVVCAGIAGMLLSLWIVLGRMSGIRQQHPVTTTFGYTFFSGLFLLLFYPFAQWFFPSGEFTRFDFNLYFAYKTETVLYCLFAGLFPALLAFTGMRQVEASIAGILLLLEPVSAAVLAALWFAEPLTLNIIAGGGLVLLSNYVILRTGKKVRKG